MKCIKILTVTELRTGGRCGGERERGKIWSRTSCMQQRSIVGRGCPNFPDSTLAEGNLRLSLNRRLPVRSLLCRIQSKCPSYLQFLPKLLAFLYCLGDVAARSVRIRCLEHMVLKACRSQLGCRRVYRCSASLNFSTSRTERDGAVCQRFSGDTKEPLSQFNGSN